LIVNESNGNLLEINAKNDAGPEDFWEWRIITIEIPSLVNTKWKLVGIVDVKADDLTELEPKDCNECYTITFDTDNTFDGQTTINIIMGNYEIDYEAYTLRFTNMFMTAVGELGDGYMYAKILDKIQSFTIKDTYLHLYYNDNKNYLKYKKKEMAIALPAYHCLSPSIIY